MLPLEYVMPVDRIVLPLHTLPTHGIKLPGYEVFRQHHGPLPLVPAGESSTPLAKGVLPSDIFPGSDRVLPGRSACGQSQDDRPSISVDESPGLEVTMAPLVGSCHALSSRRPLR